MVEDDLTFGTGLVKALESEIKEHVIWTKTLAETLPYLYGDQYCYSAAVLDFVLPLDLKIGAWPARPVTRAFVKITGKAFYSSIS